MPVKGFTNNGLNTPRIVLLRKRIVLGVLILLFLMACNPSQAASPDSISSPTPRETALVEPVDAPTDQISFPTLLPTATPLSAVTPSSTSMPVPEFRNSIVFVSDRDGNKEIYRVDVDGSDFFRLTENIEDDSSPQWSFDKTRILFLSSTGTSNHLYTINPDGSEMVNLTPGAVGFNQCEWSPNSYQIACISIREVTGGNGLVLVDPDSGGTETAFTAEGRILDIAWSPEGEKIALATEDVDGIMVYNLADDSLEEYELGDGFAQSVAWSHNGNRLAYSFGPRDPEIFATLYTVKTDFVSPKRWIEEGGPEWVVSFSANDEHVLLESSRLGHIEIFFFNLEASELIQLTNTEEAEGNASSANGFPVYSADGTRIVYVSIQEGQSDIFVMDSDGTRQRNLTEHPAVDAEPDW